MAPSGPSKSRATSKFLSTSKCIREVTAQHEFVHEVLYTNQTDRNLELTDVNLICDGGKIPAHAAVLQSVSPFLRDAFESQGDNYGYVRDIIFPDVPYKLMKYVIQLIYTGTAYFNTQDDSKAALELIRDLQIKIDDDSLTSTRTRERSVETIRAIKCKSKQKKEDKIETGKDSKKSKKKSSSKDSYDSEGIISDGDSAYNSVSNKRSRRRKVSSRNKKRKKSDSDSPFPTDDSDEEWVEPNYSDKKWFDKEARRCQFCNEEYDNPAQASTCVTGHSWLRCYFCFQVCEDTEKLFEHFKKRHKPAGRENCLLCPYCEQSVQYRSVSCHVISFHLSHIKPSKPNGRAIKPKPENKTPTKISNSTKQANNKLNETGPAKLVDGKKQPVVVISERVDDSKLMRSSGKARTFNESHAKTKSRKRNRDSIISDDEEEENDDSESNHPQKKQTNGTLMKSGDGDPNDSNICELDTKDSISASPCDVTIKRQALDGRIWVWRVRKLNF